VPSACPQYGVRRLARASLPCIVACCACVAVVRCRTLRLLSSPIVCVGSQPVASLPWLGNVRSTFIDNRKSTRQFTYYLWTSTHNVNKHGRHRRSAINIRPVSLAPAICPLFCSFSAFICSLWLWGVVFLIADSCVRYIRTSIHKLFLTHVIITNYNN